MMPKLDGYEVCRRLKADEKTLFIPIVMITALKEPEERIQGIIVGADDFLTKPFNKLELMALGGHPPGGPWPLKPLATKGPSRRPGERGAAPAADR